MGRSVFGKDEDNVEEDTDEEDEVDEEYQIFLNCTNCGETHDDPYFIPERTTVEQFCKTKECPNCKCCCLESDEEEN